MSPLSGKEAVTAQSLQAALALHQQGRLDEAARLYDAILAKAPMNADVLHLRGVLHHQLGDNEAAMPLIRRAVAIDRNQAHYHNNLGLVALALGRAAEAEAAYREALRLVPKHADAMANLGGLLVQTGKADEAERVLLAATKAAPRHGNAWMNLGNAQRSLGKPGPAERAHRTAVRLIPLSEQAWLNLATSLIDTERLDGARRALKRAAVLAPALVEAWNNLGFLEINFQATSAAARAFGRAVHLAPTYASPWSGLAEVAWIDDDLPTCLVHSSRAVELSPDDPGIMTRHGMRLLGAGRLVEGHEAREARLLRPDAIRHIGAPPRWWGEPLDGKRLLICSEEGIGDEILYSECFQDAIDRAAHVFIECDRRVEGVFRRSFPAATIRAHRRAGDRFRPVQDHGWLPKDPPVDFHIDAASLPLHLRRSIEDHGDGAAFLVPEPARVDALKARLAGLGPGPKVGISWRSKVVNPYRSMHYTTLDDWRDVLSMDGVQFVSMQYGQGWKQELRAVERRHGARVHVLDDLDLSDDFESIFALAAALDLVICVSSTLNWVGGAVGTPTWVVHIRPLFVKLGTDGFPGFASIRGFDKAVADPWDGVFEQVRTELARLIESAGPAA